MRRPTAVIASIAAVLLLGGCGAVLPELPTVASEAGRLAAAAQERAPVTIEIADPGSGTGSLVSAETMPNLSLPLRLSGVQAARVVYRSVAREGGPPQEVSAAVFVPAGDAPEGGWPIIAYGHGTTGIDVACGPTLSNSLLGGSALVQGYTAAGYAVAFPDFEGLGHPGVHAYLDNIAAGYDMIDAVRALRRVFPSAGTEWAAFGGSQGGGAAWAAAELAESHAPELNLVGAAALAPGANMVGLVDKARAGTLTADQAPLLQWVLESLARRDSSVNRDDFRSGSAAADWDALTGCTPDAASARDAAVQRLGPRDLAPRSEQDAELLRERLAQMAVPQRPLEAPLLVAYGDADTYIDADWTDGAVAQACSLGGVITVDRQAGRGHGDVDGDTVNEWLGDRFAGIPAGNDCT